jgi:hypothetical protein
LSPLGFRNYSKSLPGENVSKVKNVTRESVKNVQTEKVLKVEHEAKKENKHNILNNVTYFESKKLFELVVGGKLQWQ